MAFLLIPSLGKSSRLEEPPSVTVEVMVVVVVVTVTV